MVFYVLLLALLRSPAAVLLGLCGGENEQMGSELAFQNRQTEGLLQKNSKLALDNRNCKRELELHKQTEAEMARRSAYDHKQICIKPTLRAS